MVLSVVLGPLDRQIPSSCSTLIARARPHYPCIANTSTFLGSPHHRASKSVNSPPNFGEPITANRLRLFMKMNALFAAGPATRMERQTGRSGLPSICLKEDETGQRV